MDSVMWGCAGVEVPGHRVWHVALVGAARWSPSGEPVCTHGDSVRFSCLPSWLALGIVWCVRGVIRLGAAFYTVKVRTETTLNQ